VGVGGELEYLVVDLAAGMVGLLAVVDVYVPTELGRDERRQVEALRDVEATNPGNSKSRIPTLLDRLKGLFE